MKIQNKRQLAAFGLSLALALTLTACGEKQPSQDEVEQAIEAGTLTVEDALSRGWVDQAWVDAYIEANSVPAGSKMEANALGEFTTKTLSGETFTKADLGSVVFFAFVNPSDPDAEVFYQALKDAHEGVTENGAAIVLCTKSESENELFTDAPFPVILYNDSLKTAMGGNSGMVEDEEVPNTGSWYVNGSFLSAWIHAIDKTELVESSASFVEMSQDQAFEAVDGANGNNTNNNGTNSNSANSNSANSNSANSNSANSNSANSNSANSNSANSNSTNSSGINSNSINSSSTATMVPMA